MRHFISLSDVQSSKSQMPKYLYLSTLSMGIALNVMVEFSNIFRFLETIINFVFLVLIFKPIDLLCSPTLLTSCCRSCILSAIKTVSSAYRILLIYTPLTLTPISTSSKASWKIASEYKLNKSGDSTHPCRTPLLICMVLDILLSNFICAVWFQYRFSMHRMSF